MRAPKPRWPLHTRIALAFGALMSVVVGAVLALWIGSSETYELELTQELNRDVARHLAEHALPLSAEGINQAEMQGMLMHVMSVNPALEVYLLDATGKILAFDAPEGHVKSERVGLQPVTNFLAGDEFPILGDNPRSPLVGSPISVWPVISNGKDVGYVYVVLNSEALRDTAGPLRGSRQLETYAYSAIGVLLVGILVNFFLARYLTRPLRELRDAIGSGRSELPARLLRAQDELGLLTQTYASMNEQIQEQVETLEQVDHDRRQFVASVSHDLRTPLASLQGYLELLDEGAGVLSSDQHEYVSVARRQALHLSHLVDQLFQLAKLEAGDVEAQLETFNLAELTQDVLQGMRQRAAKSGVHLRCRLPRELPDSYGDIGLMERAVTNLLDNALKFTPSGGEVSVRLLRKRAGVEWTVQDSGPGIPIGDIDHVFERRFRGSVGTPGTGLGLAITRRVLELHGSSVSVESEEGEGCTFQFLMPTKLTA
ncbi:MAG: signal transduction histidine kinase [Planctomycetota bacterium]|jgi:signal transduction histidine kinase